VAFAAAELRVKEPMLPLGHFRNRAFSGAQAAAFAISASFFAIFVYTTLYLQEILGLSAVEAGAVYLPATIAVFVVSGVSAQLTARVGAGLLITVGLVLVAAGMGLMTLAGATSSWAMLIPGLVVAGIGTGLFNPAVSAVALGSLPGDQSGLAAGANDTFRQAGIAVGVAAFGAIVPGAAALGHGSATAYVDGLHTALIAGAALAAAGAVVSAVLLGVRRAGSSTEAGFEPAVELQQAA
jgi:predicted MFS family arabinose efflux permease